MAGEENLQKLLGNMSPVLSDEEYVFITVTGVYGDFVHLKPIGSFLEKEGLTLVIPKNIAVEQDLDFETAFKRITLEVHSSLNAVGLTSAVATKLKENGISANVIAGYFHDHVFVQSHLSQMALKCLEAFSD